VFKKLGEADFAELLGQPVSQKLNAQFRPDNGAMKWENEGTNFKSANPIFQTPS